MLRPSWRPSATRGGCGLSRLISDFTFPWSDQPAPKTTFRALTDDGRLHFAFDVEDADVIVADEWTGEATVDGEDRVELFFAKDESLTSYWCLEIDPAGRVHDYHARFPGSSTTTGSAQDWRRRRRRHDGV